MNTKHIFATALLFAAVGASVAQQGENRDGGSPKSRAEVAVELQQAQADGNAATYGFLGTTNPAAAAGNFGNNREKNVITRGKTRADVRAELEQAQTDGTPFPTGFVAYNVPQGYAKSKIATSAVVHK